MIRKEGELMLAFLISMMVGGFFGVLAMVLAFAASQADSEMGLK